MQHRYKVISTGRQQQTLNLLMLHRVRPCVVWESPIYVDMIVMCLHTLAHPDYTIRLQMSFSKWYLVIKFTTIQLIGPLYNKYKRSNFACCRSNNSHAGRSYWSVSVHPLTIDLSSFFYSYAPGVGSTYDVHREQVLWSIIRKSHKLYDQLTCPYDSIKTFLQYKHGGHLLKSTVSGKRIQSTIQEKPAFLSEVITLILHGNTNISSECRNVLHAHCHGL